MGIYQITAIKYDGKEVEGILKVPDDGEITLHVETDTVSEDSKFYGLILGKYYEIILENSEITLGDEKSLSEIEAGATVSELTAVLEKENEANTNVDIVVDQNQKEVTIKGKGVNTGRGAGIVKISYGNTRNIGIDVVETFTVTVQAEQENNVAKGAIISPSVTTQKYASGSQIILEATANTGYKFKDWYDGDDVIEETNFCNYTISKNVTITARFEVKKLYGEQVLINGGNPIIVKTVTEEEKTTNFSIDDNWKLFYIDDDDNNSATAEYVHLIYGDYYPVNVQTQIVADVSVFAPACSYNSTTNKYDKISSYTWSVNSQKNRLTLLSYLKNNSSYAVSNLDESTPVGNYDSWVNLATSLTGTGKTLNGKTIRIQGAPNITMWKDSWNEQGYKELVLQNATNGFRIAKKVTSGTQTYSDSLSLSRETGYNDKLYFPNTGRTATTEEPNADKAGAYWLASPGAGDYAWSLCSIICEGSVGFTGSYYWSEACSARPVVSILKSDFQELEIVKSGV